VRRAWELNVPARTASIRADAARPVPRNFVSISGAEAIIEALKPAENGRGLILRVTEPHGARGEVTVSTGNNLQFVMECNHVEEDLDAIASNLNGFTFFLKPFQIRSFRILTDMNSCTPEISW